MVACGGEPVPDEKDDKKRREKDMKEKEAGEGKWTGQSS